MARLNTHCNRIINAAIKHNDSTNLKFLAENKHLPNTIREKAGYAILALELSA